MNPPKALERLRAKQYRPEVKLGDAVVMHPDSLKRIRRWVEVSQPVHTLEKWGDSERGGTHLEGFKVLTYDGIDDGEIRFARFLQIDRGEQS